MGRKIQTFLLGTGITLASTALYDASLPEYVSKNRTTYEKFMDPLKDAMTQTMYSSEFRAIHPEKLDRSIFGFTELGGLGAIAVALAAGLRRRREE